MFKTLRIVVDRDGVEKTEYRHKFGGTPYGIDEKGQPKCKNCGTPLQLLFQLDTSDPLLESYRFKDPFVFIYFCDGCDSRWEPTFYQVNETSVEVITQTTGDKWGLENTVYDEFPAHLEPITHEEVQSAKRKFSDNNGFGKFNWLGVEPKWIQRKKVVRCPECKEKMEFIGQLDSGMTMKIGNRDLVFGDVGALYIHRCSNCNIFSTFIQSY